MTKGTKNKRILFILPALVVCVLAVLVITFVLLRPSKEKYKNALYIYICGSDLETNGGSATRNIDEILAANIPKDTCVIIQTGGSKKWQKYDIKSDKLTRYIVKNHKLVVLETLENASMGDAETLEAFAEFCIDNYIAENCGFIFWDHGDSGSAGVCLDQNFNYDYLTLNEISHGLIPFAENDIKLEFLGFDACLMASFDTVMMAKDFSRYLIASEETEPSSGWDYKLVVSDFGQKGFYKSVLESYAVKCEKRKNKIYTLACIDLSKWEELQAAFYGFIEHMETLAEHNLATLVKYANDSTNFGANSKYVGYSDLVDLLDFAENTGYQQMGVSLAECVEQVHGEAKPGIGGISIFFPFNNQQNILKYLAARYDSLYSGFLTDYFIDSSLEDNIRFENRGFLMGSELRVTVDETSAQNIATVCYYVTMYETDDINSVTAEADCYELGGDGNVIESYCNYTTTFGGVWPGINGNIINVVSLDQSDNWKVYATEIKRNGRPGEMIFAYDFDTKEFTIQGFMERVNSVSINRIDEFAEGDVIELIEPGENHEHSAEPGNTFLYSADTKIELMTVPDGIYLIRMVFQDLYLNYYFSNELLIQYKDGKVYNE